MPTADGRFALVLEVAELAIAEARRSPCVKSRRGVVVFDPATGGVMGRGFNAQPDPFTCTRSDACRAVCGRVCVHAEVRAIREAVAVIGPGKFPLAGLDGIHAKVDLDTGRLVPSGGPSCWQCSREVMDSGLNGFWLYLVDGDRPRWRYWSAMEFHAQTLRACGIDPLPQPALGRP